MHKTFSADDPAVADYFKALRVDPMYARMCRNQKCFRARISPKPWRIGISQHMKPRPGTWPVKSERLQERAQWISTYEDTARAYAACRFVEALGSRTTHPAAREIQSLHDEECRAMGSLPLA
jgi:hypothetical protein